MGSGMRAVEVSAVLHDGAMERCVGTRVYARVCVCVCVCVYECALVVSVGGYLCWLVPKHTGVQTTLPDLSSQSVCSAEEVNELLTPGVHICAQTDRQAGR